MTPKKIKNNPISSNIQFILKFTQLSQNSFVSLFLCVEPPKVSLFQDI